MRQGKRGVVEGFAFRFVAILVGVTLSLAILELGLKISNVWIGRHSDTMFQVIEYDDFLGWRMKPNVVAKVDLVDVEDITVRSNSSGFWDSEFPIEKSPARCRVMFLGDSFTWGMGVREEERFSNLVAAIHPGWECLNMGIPGYGTDQSLLVWERYASVYEPNWVVLTVFQNDYSDNMFVVRNGRRKPYFVLMKSGELNLRESPVPEDDFWSNGIYNQPAQPYYPLLPNGTEKRSRLVHWLAKNSDVVRLLYTYTRSPLGLAPAGTVRTPFTAASNLTPLQELQIELEQALLERLAKEADAVGVRFVVVLAGEPVPQFQMQEQLLVKAGIEVIDATTQVLEGKLPPGDKQVYHPYSRHWTPAAHRAVAVCIADRIRGDSRCPK